MKYSDLLRIAFLLLIISFIIISCTDGIFPSLQSIRVENKTEHDIEFTSYSISGRKSDNYSFSLKSGETFDMVESVLFGRYFNNFFSPSGVDSLVLKLDGNEIFNIYCDSTAFGTGCDNPLPEFDFLLDQHGSRGAEAVYLDKPIKINGKRVSYMLIFEIEESDIEGLRELQMKEE